MASEMVVPDEDVGRVVSEIDDCPTAIGYAQGVTRQAVYEAIAACEGGNDRGLSSALSTALGAIRALEERGL